LSIEQKLLARITDGTGDFEKLALEVFAFQFERNPPYRAYCTRAGRTPATVTHWHDIPAVPTSAFKEMTIACFPVAEAAAEFHTSGTTIEKSGKHFFKTTDLYHAAIRPNFAAHLLPDGARVPMFVLTPSREEAPNSSLSHMMGEVMRDFGTADSAFYVTGNELNLQRLVRDLCEAQWASQPVFLLGTAFSFVHLFDHLAGEGVRFQLPAGSRAMETGGFKGRSRAMSKPELYKLFEQYLGMPGSQVVNEYGMTELSTQFYDETMRVKHQTNRKRPPAWSRVLIVDPHTANVAPAGKEGLIRVFDLANLWSSLCVQTEDLGVAGEDGSFEILGRAAGAEVRGCSLTAESWKQG
jgi:hypothetical protein